MTNTRRILADLVLFILIFTSPWWAAFLLGILFLFMFENFYEFLVLGFILDNLYGTGGRVLPVPVLYTLLSMALFCTASPLKRRLKFY